MGGFWTPYRRGIVVALLGWASGLGFVAAFFAMMVDGVAVPMWLFAVLMVIGAITGGIMDAHMWERGKLANCPACGKSVFLLYGWKTRLGATGCQLWWPEKDCSECLFDLTLAQPA